MFICVLAETDLQQETFITTLKAQPETIKAYPCISRLEKWESKSNFKAYIG